MHRNIRAASLAAVTLAALLGLNAPVQAQELITLQTSNGVVPNPGIAYTITDTNGTPRAIFPSGSSDNNVFLWTTRFNEFVLLSGGLQTLTVNFAAPVSINQIVLGAESYYNNQSIFLTVAGGTATTADFDLTDSLQALTGPTGTGSYNGATGRIDATGADQSIMIGSTSANTISSFTITANNSEGYTLFFGTVNASAVPEPGSVALLVGVAVAGAGFARKRRNCC